MTTENPDAPREAQGDDEPNGDHDDRDELDEREHESTTGGRVPVEAVSPNPQNPRVRVDEVKVDELVDSIAEVGLLQPVLVRPDPNSDEDGYEVVHGTRRLHAVERLGHDTIRAEIRELSDREALEVAITENLQREDVSPIAEARSYQALIDEFGLTQAQAAERLGTSQSHISNRLKLLDLPDRLQDDILRKIFSPWQARELDRVWGTYWLYDLALDWELSVRQLRQVIDDLERGTEYVSLTTEWTADELDEYWGRAPTDASTDAEADANPKAFLDVDGNPVTTHSSELGHAFHWMHRTLDDYEAPIERFEKTDPQPIIFWWEGKRILLGYTRLSLAESKGYTGTFEVKTIFHRSLFEWHPVEQDTAGEDDEQGDE